MPLAQARSRASEVRAALEDRVLLADGAMATRLFAKGVDPQRCCDELNLSLPALVRDVHREYLRAGAEILETNTFGANRVRLGAADRVDAINRAGVRIAREAANGEAFVAGAMGPLGVYLAPLGSMSVADAHAAFREQADALVGAGVDLLMLETFQDLRELEAAATAAREAAGPEMVIVASIAPTLPDGTSLEDAARRIERMPVDMIGVNCGSGPASARDAVQRMASVTEKPLSAMPAGGWPVAVSPEYFAQCACSAVEAGARIVGGCCGTSPEHIAAPRAALVGIRAERPAVNIAESTAADAREPVTLARRSPLGAKLAAGEFVTLIDIASPRGLHAAAEIPAGVDGFVAQSDLACVQLTAQTGLDSVLDAVWPTNPIHIQRELLRAHAMGIRNLILSATAAHIANNLNRGLDLGGNDLGGQTEFVIGSEDVHFTPPVYDASQITPGSIPVIATIRVLASLREAEHALHELHEPVPLDAFREPGAGVAFAIELAARLRPMVAGLRFVSAQPETAAAVVR